ncbi:MAG: hypothetical protein KA314_01515 [Chloroflexi bacterium]|nr:hypothetical protein [Chloroflexota bacterium]MBP8054486.1 hypothetical protein [Chloroflexota bacterium]
MRDTPYAKEIKRAILSFPDNTECRIEKLEIKETGNEEIRFSWWKNNNIVPRPLDIREEDLLQLFKNAIQEEVFSPKFLNGLKELLE